MKEKLQSTDLSGQQKRMELLLEGEKAVLEMIATGKPLNEILNTVALHYEANAADAICSILLLDKEGTHLRHGAGPGLSDSYNNAIDGEPIGPVAGSCGTAAYRKERVIVSDIATDPLWVNYRDLALSNGLKACWSTPIIGNADNVLGTFAIYYREPRLPSPEDLALVDKISNLVKIAMKRYYKEVQLKESEEKYRNLIEQASDAIMIYGFDGTPFDCNQATCTLSGYTKEEFLNLKLSDLISEEGMGQLPFQFESIKTGKPTIVEKRLKCKGGTSVEVEVNSRLMPDGSVMMIGRDLTERKKAERELAESENRLRTILQTEPECVKVLNQKGELLDMNPAGLAMIEADTLELVKGKTMYSLINEPYKEAFAAIIKNVFKGNPGKLEFEITGLEGTPRWLKTNAVPLRNSAGKIISLLGVSRDVTERKKISEQIKIHHEQLRQLTVHLQNVREEERAALSRELHDELGQKLTAIKMDLSWMNSNVKANESLTAKISEAIGLTNDAVSTVRRINSELRPALLDDLGLFASLEYQLNEFSKRFNVKGTITLGMDEPRLEAQQSIAIFRIFQEALTNIARHACAKSVNARIQQVNGQMELIISDDGVGFRQEDVRIKKSFGILGMRERAMMMNGTLQVTSKQGEGTTLQLLVPV